MAEIKRLENELNRAINALTNSFHAEHILREELKSNTKTLGDIEELLKSTAENLKDSNEYIGELKQENRMLKSSVDEWKKRALKLQFELLNGHGAAEK